MRCLLILPILCILTGCSQESRRNLLDWMSAPVKMVMPSKTHEVAPESTQDMRVTSGRFDGVLLAVAVSGIFLCAISRYKVGLALLASGAGGFVLIDLLGVIRIWVHIGATILLIGAVGYFVYWLWNSHSRTKSLKFE